MVASAGPARAKACRSRPPETDGSTREVLSRVVEGSQWAWRIGRCACSYWSSTPWSGSFMTLFGTARLSLSVYHGPVFVGRLSAPCTRSRRIASRLPRSAAMCIAEVSMPLCQLRVATRDRNVQQRPIAELRVFDAIVDVLARA
eukprot:scaffold94532_cov75-Phaeocystis_antarctica.AAC.8